MTASVGNAVMDDSSPLYKGLSISYFQDFIMTVPCEYCGQTLKNRSSYRTHKSKFHRYELGINKSFVEKPGIGKMKSYQSKTGEEIANEDLDNNKHLYDEKEWKYLKREFNKIPCEQNLDLSQTSHNNNSSKSFKKAEIESINNGSVNTRSSIQSNIDPDDSDFGYSGESEEEFYNHEEAWYEACPSRRRQSHSGLTDEEVDFPRCGYCCEVYSTEKALCAHIKTHLELQQRQQPLRHHRPSVSSYDGESDSDYENMDSQSDVIDNIQDNITKDEIRKMYYDNAEELTSKFLEIKDLIDQREFKTLAGDSDLLMTLRILFIGIIKRYLKLDRRQISELTNSIKRFMFKFVRDTDSSPTVLLTHKSILTNLFKVLYNNEDS